MKQRHNLHLKQFLVIGAVAVSGLFAGSLLAGDKKITSPPPSPSPSPKPSFITPLAIAPAPTINPASPTPLPTVKPKVVAQKPAAVKPKRSGFVWGITIQPFPFRESNEQFLPEQYRLAKELEVTTIRTDYAPNNEAMNRLAVEQAKKHGLKLIFIIPFGPKDIFTDDKLYDNAYNYVSEIVKKHKDDVDTWQLANEVASVSLVDGLHHGVDRVDYPEDKYKAVSTWLKAASKAVADHDPGAKRLITDHWIHVGFFERFLAEGGEFEILGWNWFSDMGTDMNRVVIDKNTGQVYKLLDKLKTFKKELWLTEVNRRLGSSGGKEKDQADYIQKMAEYAYGNSALNGFLIYNLVEDQTARVEESGYSIVNIDLDKKWVAGLKLAFSRYQGLIRAKK